MMVGTKRVSLVNYIASALVALVALSALHATAGEEVYTGFLGDTALSGYDAVAYFTEGKPVKGSKKHTLEYKDATWRFSSAESKTLFEQNPEQYAPQYGGFCAWAVGANSARAAGNPKYWKIVDSKLYLNYNKGVQQKWLADIPGFIAKADVNWPKMLAE